MVGDHTQKKGGGVWTALPAAVQHVYTNVGVPHTDRSGRIRMRYDPAQSFLPLTIYDPQLDCNISFGQVNDRFDHSRLLGQKCLPIGYNASIYSQANFTAALPYPAFTLGSYIESFGQHGLQVIREHPTMNEVAKYANHPNLLGWYLEEEPTGRYWTVGEPEDNQTKMVNAFNAYKAQYAAIKKIDPVHPVFILDCPWFSSDGKGNDPLPWWTKWNSYGDVSSHDNYPFDYRSTSLSTINGDGGGIPESVALAAKINHERKPVWLCVQAFEASGFGKWLMPDSREMRTQVYTGIVHGATGIIYFAMDSLFTRAGYVAGFGPRSLLNMSYHLRHNIFILIGNLD
jgi:hypothetical protein